LTILSHGCPARMLCEVTLRRLKEAKQRTQILEKRPGRRPMGGSEVPRYLLRRQCSTFSMYLLPDDLRVRHGYSASTCQVCTPLNPASGSGLGTYTTAPRS
jgi:hypothetical protein